MSTLVINTSVSESRSVPRIWLEGDRLGRAGVQIGVQYIVNVSAQLRRIELRPAPKDYVGKSIVVSKRTRNDRVYPLIEFRDSMINQLFKIGSKLRVSIQSGRILISLSHIATRIQERVSRFLRKLENNEPLQVASMFHGGGIADKAIHQGLERGKLASYVKIAIELDGDCLDSSIRNNPELFRDDSILINGDIRDVNVLGSGISQVDVAIAGIPCTGASRSGVSRNKLKFAEEHTQAGTLFHDFIEWVKVFNPFLVVMENVFEYQKSVGMTVIRSVLSHYGYVISEAVLEGAKLGTLEKRNRLCMIAITPGVCDPVDFGNLVPVRVKEDKMADILDFVPEDSPQWKSYDYLAAKAIRDKEAGKGFERQLLTGEEDGCGVLGRGYAKARSTECQIIAPHNPKLTRLLSPAEHARVKAIPESVIEGLCATTAHCVLGQSVSFPAFVAVGELIAKTVKGLVKTLSRPVSESDEIDAAHIAVSETPVKPQAIQGTLQLFELTA